MRNDVVKHAHRSHQSLFSKFDPQAIATSSSGKGYTR